MMNLTATETEELGVALGELADLVGLPEYQIGDSTGDWIDSVVEIVDRIVERRKTGNCPACGEIRPGRVSEDGQAATFFEPGSVCPHCGHVEPGDSDD